MQANEVDPKQAMPPLSEEGFDVLKSAVTLAKTQRYQSLKSLHEALVALWPGKEQLVTEAMRFWSANVRARHPGGVRL